MMPKLSKHYGRGVPKGSRAKLFANHLRVAGSQVWTWLNRDRTKPWQFSQRDSQFTLGHVPVYVVDSREPPSILQTKAYSIGNG
ncbi:hypothetical protein AVEN_82815-1 [Araneus ventricosus]|uniref:Uncharacterized protein n=1 Tax=Araneus ventricosus TaxID=182803 RepID=A0A4Y2F901_ARAVE|nr:hypothetical protein AVEN_82815-1 [Araneus ventricosus]